MDGHEVDTAANGAVALTMLDKQTYDLVLSDTKMPVLDGEEFYRELAHRAPSLRSRIIFVTGDVISREKRAFLEATGAPFLLKPFAPHDARRLVHQMLAGAP
jgi:CheY-like chemotaxis protein